MKPKRIYPEEDILVFKFLLKERNGEKKTFKYTSPFYPAYWTRNKMAKAIWPEELNTDMLMWNSRGEPYLGPGMFHAFKDAKDALYEAGRFKQLRDRNTVVGVFKIPKDTEVYEGVISGTNSPGYASKEMQFIGIY